MIRLKRLNNTIFLLNPELIEQIESAPDTVITLTTGNNFIVRESLDEVVELIMDYRRDLIEKRQAALQSKFQIPTAKFK